MKQNAFTKKERLTNKKTFEFIFESGKNISVFPFKLMWLETENSSLLPVHIGIAVPKKQFAKAVDRNIIKRRIRESFRKNKHALYETLKKKNISIALMIIYIAKEEMPYSEIEKKMIVSLQELNKDLENINL